MSLDRDLASIQEVRDCIRTAKKAQAAFAQFDQAQVDRIVTAMKDAAVANAARLAKMAVEDTGFGVEKDKVTKNLFAAQAVYDSIKDVRTIGIIGEDKEKKIIEAAVPVGIVAGLVPSTNPTSTTIFKSLISLKAGNAVIFSPHPSAIRCISETVNILTKAACAAGAPEGLIQTLTMATLQGTTELMKLSDLILATGGSAMVKAAYSSGTPALGVGPGNVPAFIERTADIPLAVKRIIASKSFDNGTICASEQAIVCERCIKDEVISQFRAQGGYFVSGEDAEKLAKVIQRPGREEVNPQIVGRSPQVIAQLAGIRVPEGTKVILCETDKVGGKYPYSIEKLSPILAFYTQENWEDACERCLELLNFTGIGHSLSLHTNNPELVRTFVAKKPVSRLMVNTGSTQGGIGAITGLAPSLTLGCGSVGGSATSDNVTVTHMFNVRRAAYGLMEPWDLAKDQPACTASTVCNQDVEAIVEAVLRQLGH